MTVRRDLKAVRDAVAAGEDWLAAMIRVSGDLRGGKRFVAMHTVLMEAGPKPAGSLSLSDFLMKMERDDIVAFFDGVIASAGKSGDRKLPSWPLLSLQAEVAA